MIGRLTELRIRHVILYLVEDKCTHPCNEFFCYTLKSSNNEFIVIHYWNTLLAAFTCLYPLIKQF